MATDLFQSMPKYGLCMLSPTELSRRRIKPFSYPGQAFFIAASMQQAQFCAAKHSARVGVA